jgi:7,8-dihydropterin-6-yl-methyl-4-(beta-D-ribofuranosyl)aminobenzene 5'-phosphate synthase
MPEIESNHAVCDSNKVNITVIYDNNSFKDDLGTSWGFSCLVTGVEKTILFDTGGDGSLLLDNMTKLGIDPNSIELIVLSHEHWDHIGGMAKFLDKNHNVSVYLLESFQQKIKDMVRACGAKFIEIQKPARICRGVYTTGQLGTSIKEQGLIVRTDKGMILITGCAHPGIDEMARKTKEIFNDNVLFVMGGFHLNASSKTRINDIVKTLKGFGVKYAAPSHCTGDNARALFAEQFGENYLNIGAGRIIAMENFK